MKISTYILVTFMFTLAVAPAGAQAATINVTANAPDVLGRGNGSCSLREAISNINNAAGVFPDCVAIGSYGTSDTINLPEGVYTNAITSTDEDANADGDLDILKYVTITGAGMSTTVIDGGGIDRVFHVGPVPPSSNVIALVISEVTIQNGSRAWYGGGIFNANFSKLTVTNCTIRNNAGIGGGIYNGGFMATVINTTISGNYFSGIANGFGATLTVTNSTISDNTGGDELGSVGGGIDNTMGLVTVTNSTITANSACNGGGLANRDFGRMRVLNSTIAGNTTIDAGCSGLSGLGGGIFSDLKSGSGITSIINSTISGNYAFIGGGGISSALFSGRKTVILNSTITGNRINDPSLFGGGGVLNASPGHYYEMKNTIVANQVFGDDCAIRESASVFFGTVFNSLDSDYTCGAEVSANPLLGPLANNGGGTYTHELLTRSPAIDTGDAAVCAGMDVNNLDQRCVSRPQGSTCDIGAFEKASFSPIGCPSTLTIGGTVTGLASGNSLVLQNNAENLTVSSNGNFTFANAEAFGGVYGVIVAIQPTPSNQSCSVANGYGTVSGVDNITNIYITCVYVDTDNDGIPDDWDNTPNIQDANACTGDHATLQGTFVTGTQTSCRAAQSVTTEGSVMVQSNAILAIVSPQTNVGSGFNATTGSMVWIVAKTPVEE